METDFSLATCCSKNQYIMFGSIGASVLISLILWTCKILDPFKLLTVFLHEFSHASACWLTGGKVSGIEVNKDHGGVTNTSGGCQCIILPAGYIGSCFYGMFFILMAYFNVWTLVASAIFLSFLLLVVLLFYAKNMCLRVLCILFLIITISTMVLCFLFKEALNFWPLKIIMTFIGVLNELYSMVDIIEDLITRTVPESDAYRCASLTGCNSKLCGVLWFIVNLGFITLTVYLIAAIDVPPFYSYNE